MTKAAFDALKFTIPGARPFASGVNASATAPGATTGDFSMPDGFGSAFDSAPASDGANMVQRGQMNYIGKMASYVPFLGQTGGSFWGFDPAVCVALEGYPKDAILTLVKDGCYLKIISLKDNNYVDFTGATDKSQTTYSSIVNGSVDGVNWQYLSLDPQTLIDQSVIAEIPETMFSFKLSQPLNVFKASNQSALVVSGGINCEIDPPDEEATGQRLYVWYVRVVVSPPKASLSDLDDWEPLDSNNTTIFRTGGTSDSTDQPVKTVITEAGKYYGVGLCGSSWAPTGSTSDNWTMNVKIASSTLKIHLKAI